MEASVADIEADQQFRRGLIAAFKLAANLRSFHPMIDVDTMIKMLEGYVMVLEADL